MVDLGISGKTALVTGGTRGIGGEISRALLEEGVRVVATSRNQENITRFSDQLVEASVPRFHGVCHSLKLDEIDTLVSEIGSLQLSVDILVNNAGDTLQITDPFCELEDWNRVIALNALLPIELSRRFLPSMVERGWGRVVNITSCAGLENSGPVTFSTAKAAITAYSRSMGRVLATTGKDVVMSAVFPGVVATEGGHWDEVLRTDPERATKYLSERCPAGRFGTEREVASTVLFYCSELASFSHGAIVPVDGGQSKHYLAHNYLS